MVHSVTRIRVEGEAGERPIHPTMANTLAKIVTIARQNIGYRAETFTIFGETAGRAKLGSPQAELQEAIQELAEQMGVAPERLRIEVSESTLIKQLHCGKILTHYHRNPEKVLADLEKAGCPRGDALIFLGSLERLAHAAKNAESTPSVRTQDKLEEVAGTEAALLDLWVDTRDRSANNRFSEALSKQFGFPHALPQRLGSEIRKSVGIAETPASLAYADAVRAVQIYAGDQTKTDETSYAFYQMTDSALRLELELSGIRQAIRLEEDPGKKVALEALFTNVLRAHQEEAEALLAQHDQLDRSGHLDELRAATKKSAEQGKRALEGRIVQQATPKATEAGYQLLRRAIPVLETIVQHQIDRMADLKSFYVQRNLMLDLPHLASFQAIIASLKKQRLGNLESQYRRTLGPLYEMSERLKKAPNNQELQQAYTQLYQKTKPRLDQLEKKILTELQNVPESVDDHFRSLFAKTILHPSRLENELAAERRDYYSPSNREFPKLMETAKQLGAMEAEYTRIRAEVEKQKEAIDHMPDSPEKRARQQEFRKVLQQNIPRLTALTERYKAFGGPKKLKEFESQMSDPRLPLATYLNTGFGKSWRGTARFFNELYDQYGFTLTTEADQVTAKLAKGGDYPQATVLRKLHQAYEDTLRPLYELSQQLRLDPDNSKLLKQYDALFQKTSPKLIALEKKFSEVTNAWLKVEVKPHFEALFAKRAALITKEDREDRAIEEDLKSVIGTSRLLELYQSHLPNVVHAGLALPLRELNRAMERLATSKRKDTKVGARPAVQAVVEHTECPPDLRAFLQRLQKVL